MSNIHYLQDMIDSLHQCQALSQLDNYCEKFSQEMGADNFIYGGWLATSFIRPREHIINGYPQAWWQRYVEHDYLSMDPVVSHCMNSTLPVIWHDLTRSLQGNQSSVDFMGEAADFGLRTGITTPVHGVMSELGLLSLSFKQNNKQQVEDIRVIAPLVSHFTSHLYETIRRLYLQFEESENIASLTQREKECLLWVSEGKTAWEIAQILSVSERTVVYHLNNIGVKLKVNNRQQALARAIALGLINPMSYIHISPSRQKLSH